MGKIKNLRNDMVSIVNPPPFCRCLSHSCTVFSPTQTLWLRKEIGGKRESGLEWPSSFHDDEPIPRSFYSARSSLSVHKPQSLLFPFVPIRAELMVTPLWMDGLWGIDLSSSLSTLINTLHFLRRDWLNNRIMWQQSPVQRSWARGRRFLLYTYKSTVGKERTRRIGDLLKQ